MDVNALLRAQDWAALAKHFASSQPVNAQDFQARALLALSRGDGRIDWPAVLGDLGRACELQPADGMLRANLAQALLDSGQSEEAYVQAQRAVQLAPQAYAPLDKLAMAAAATRRWEEARDTVVRAALLVQGKRPLPEAAARLMMQLQPRWWVPVKSAGLVLRRPEVRDADFLARLFDDADYMRRFHRFQRSGAHAVRKFIEIGQQAPSESRRLDWMIDSRDGETVGLAGIVDIDWPNQRGELVVGVVDTASSMTALQASVAVIDFAFNRMGLRKLVSYVYADNPEAQANTLHLGFTQEGLLRSHVVAGNARVDLFVNGMLPQDYQGNERLQKLAARWVSSRT